MKNKWSKSLKKNISIIELNNEENELKQVFRKIKNIINKIYQIT